ncbi:MAG: tetratricopeptide repeat protein [Phycisphaeraceae bacterium]|nr:tetratricopeptide repeat protein [Phycisphaeraceae bacterium]
MRALMVSLVILMLALGGCGRSTEVKIEMGKLALQNRKFDEALKLAEEVLAKQPRHQEAARLAAEAETRLGRFDESRKRIDDLIAREDSGIADHRLMAGWSLSKAAMLISRSEFVTDEEAWRRLERVLLDGRTAVDWVLAHGDEPGQARFNRARLFEVELAAVDLDIRRLEESVEMRVQRQATGHTPAPLAARYRQRDELIAEALHELARAIEKMPDDVRAHRSLISLSERDGRWEDIWELSAKVAERSELDSQLAVAYSGSLRRFPGGMRSPVELRDRVKQLLVRVPEGRRDNRDWQVAMARVRATEGDFERSRQHADRALSRAPADVEALYLLGLCLLELGEYEQARQKLEDIPSRNRNNTQYHLVHGRVMQALNQEDLARRSFREAVNIDPTNVEARRLWNAAMVALGRRDTVRSDIESFYSSNPTNPVAINEWLTFLLRENETALAAELLRVTSGIEDKTFAHLEILHRGHAALNDMERSEAYARQAVERFNDRLESHVMLAGALIGRGEEAQAREVLRAARERFDDAPAMDMVFAQLSAQQGRLDNSIDLLAEVIRREPGNIAARVLRAQSLMRLALLEEAEMEAREVIAREPNHPQANAILAQIFQQTNRMDEASEHLARIDETGIDPRRQPLLAATLAYRRGEDDRAYQIAAEGVSDGVQEPSLLIMLAEIAARKGRFDEAQRHMTEVIRRFPNSPMAYRAFFRYFSNVPQSGGLARAGEILRTLRQETGGSVWVAFAEAQLLAVTGRPEAAINSAMEVLDRTINQNPRFAFEVATFIAQVQLATNRPSEAIAVYDRLRRAEVEPSLARLRQIEIRMRLTEPQNVIPELVDFARDLDDGQEIIRRQAVMRMIQLGAHDQAIELLSRWMEERPDDMNWPAMVASAHLGRGEHDDAIKVLERAIEAAPENLRLRMMLAAIHGRRHQHPLVEAVFRDMAGIDRGAAITALGSWGQTLIQLGLTREASRVFTELEEKGRSRDPRIIYAMGQAYFQIQRDDEAFDRLGSIASYAPQYLPAQILMARIEQRKGKLDQAHQRLAALAEDRRFAARAATELLAQRFNDPESYEVLLEGLDRILDLEDLPGEGRARWVLFRITLLDRQGRWDQAIRELERLGDIADRNVNLDAARLLMLRQQGRTQASRLLYESAPHLRASPLAGVLADIIGLPATEASSSQDQGATVAMLRALARADVDKARQLLEEMPPHRFIFRDDLRKLFEGMAASPDRAREAGQLVLAARVALDLQLSGLSRELARQAAERQPANPLAYAVWGSALAQMEQSQADLVQTIRTRLPDSGLGLVIRADEARSQERYGDAADLLGQAFEREPTQVQLRFEQSQMLRLAGRVDEGIAILRTLAEGGPMQAVARNDLAYQLAEHHPDQLSEARALAEAGLSELPDHPALVDTVAWIRHLQGEHQQALEMLQSVAVPLADQPEVHYHLGAVYHALGNERWARMYLDEVMNGKDRNLAARAARLLGQAESRTNP